MSHGTDRAQPHCLPPNFCATGSEEISLMLWAPCTESMEERCQRALS